MKWLFPITVLLIAIAACTTVLFVSTLKPASTGAFIFFAVWLVSPHIIIGTVLIFLRTRSKVPFHSCVVAVILSAGGILYLADVIFWRPDAQGALAVLMTPLLQGGALMLFLSVARWITRNERN